MTKTPKIFFPRMPSETRKRTNVPVTAMMRLKNDYMRLQKEPIPLIFAEPDPSNMLVWHYWNWSSIQKYHFYEFRD